MLLLRHQLHNSPSQHKPARKEYFNLHYSILIYLNIEIYNKHLDAKKTVLTTFSTADRLRAASQEPLCNELHFPWGSPKLANLICEMVWPPWHDSSNVLPSFAFAQIEPTVMVWKDTCEGFPPISSNKINVLVSLVRNDLGTWYLIQILHI